MNTKFNEYRNTYKEIIYRDYLVDDIDNDLVITYTFEIPGLTVFKPTISFSKDLIKNSFINENLMNKIIFHIGMIELISYYKCCCPKKIVIEAGYLSDYDKSWFKKLFYNGLGEFLYKNNISISEDELFDFEVTGEEIKLEDVFYQGYGNLIPVGGGKDSVVSLELLKEYKDDNNCFIINPKGANIECCYVAGYMDEDIVKIKRVIDKNLIDLNSKGFLNGHTPFSSIVAFISYLMAYLTNKKYIVLSNENSANEATVIGTNVNHQYSKSYEFEKDFHDFTIKNYGIDINYFSMLRPLKEIQIAMLFSKYTKYHKVFKSCNLGSKGSTWEWCCNCPKCLFVYIMLSAFLSKSEMVEMFGKDLLNQKELEKDFIELIGEGETKPFECVGSISEVNFALNKIIASYEGELPYLLNLYKNNYLKDENIDLYELEENHNVISEYYDILKENVFNYEK
ncbi:MAG: hypothetical protein J6C28_04630 [Bacilli bacterium]|nr:hypothetical protein [Bacilli bacterium]